MRANTCTKPPIVLFTRPPLWLPTLLCSALACSRADDPPPAPQPPSPPTVATPSALPSPPALASATPASAPDILLLPTHDGPIPAADAQRILHVGDSMVPLVGNYLRQVLAGDKRRYEIISIPSSSTLSWARDHGLRDAIYRYDPQVVLISLGSNELFDPNPERRAAAIRQVVSETRDRPCLWIGPPAWKKDKGFLRVLQANVGRCRYFDSTRLDLERMADGRHPSWTGSYAWATAVWKELGGTQPLPTGNVQPASR